MQNSGRFDVIVVGGGHAGTEAALCAARMGVRTLLLTHQIETLGQMSCNPSIGGIGKTHLVREVDALGGAMAWATDQAGIHFRTLNSSKGPAVRATRAQADRVLYKKAIRSRLENQPNLWIFQQPVDDLILEGERVVGVKTQMGVSFFAHSVVLTTGTFLAGKIHIGLSEAEGGRAGDPAARTLATRLRDLPFRIRRLKTGTPPRIDGRTIDYTQLQAQPGDEPRPTMSFLGRVTDHPQQVSCHITHTNEQTHEIIRHGLSESPLYTGKIEGVGPRYCPSIEDKIMRFADRAHHQIFLEPEGLTTHEVYPNGISTSLSYATQWELVHSIKGLENCHITRPGYAIEYDFFDPRDLKSSLESKMISGLFFAGQINGTTGYEEAAAQGLIAGLNAARLVQGQESWSPKRDEAYVGVLIDDLITRGTNEPYRMFTSRAEYRLMLRQDNADLRLTEIGRQLGCVDDARWEAFSRKRDAIEYERVRLHGTWVHPKTEGAEAFATMSGQTLEREFRALELLKRPEVQYPALMQCLQMDMTLDAAVFEQVEIEAKYSGYVVRQQEEVDRQKGYESMRIPNHVDYSAMSGLSHEIKIKLTETKPETIGQASRIPGVTPAAVSILLIHLRG